MSAKYLQAKVTEEEWAQFKRLAIRYRKTNSGLLRLLIQALNEGRLSIRGRSPSADRVQPVKEKHQ